MSDLQCPARLLLVEEPAAGRLAASLGLVLERTSRPLRLTDLLAGDIGAAETVREIADLHRGESVVVVVEASPERPPAEGLEAHVDGDGIDLRPLRPDRTSRATHG